MRVRPAIWLLLALGWGLACGGRYEQTIEGDDQPNGGSATAAGTTSSIGGSTGKAGGSSRAGSSGKAGSSGRAGSSGKAGGSGRGGTSGVAGSTSLSGTTGVAGSLGTAAAGGICICAEPSCPPPLRAVPNANGCCDHCEADPTECAMATQGYLTYTEQILNKYQALSCMSDSDCGSLFDKNECGVAFGCGEPLLNSQIMVVMQELDAYARMNCSFACPPRAPPPCPVMLSPKCVMNRCQ